MIKRIVMAAVCAVLVAACASAQLLYRISGNGLKSPSYIIGTHHFAKVEFVDKIAGLEDALKATEQVYGELGWDELTNPDSIRMLQESMMLPEGQTLKTVLSKEQFDKLDAHLTKMMGVGLSNPQVMARMGRLSPAAIAVQLQVLSFMQKHAGDFNPTNTFDQYFQTIAKKDNKSFGGLETVSFQARVLFGSTPLKRQVQNMMCLIDNNEFSVEMTDKITEAFYAQDIEALKKAMDAKMGNTCDSTPEEKARLIDNRNAEWLKKMPGIMSAKPTFFAVGAGHLPGSKGVLQLLRNAGYTVEGVK